MENTAPHDISAEYILSNMSETLAESRICSYCIKVGLNKWNQAALSFHDLES